MIRAARLQFPTRSGHFSNGFLGHGRARRQLHVTCVLDHLRRGTRSNNPLVVGVQGPQGSGKTYLTTILRDELISPPNDLSVALISLDDLYPPHSELARVANDHPHNPLLRGRGQPGTHDVPLGTQVLNSLRRINEPDAEGTVSIPIFDKSLHSGEGDRIE
jgi:D-glycerate 3-kinase